MKRQSLLAITAVLLATALASDVHAQIAGRRSVGQGISRGRTGIATPARPSPRERAAGLRGRPAGENPGGAAEDVGQITGDERYLRENRSAADFVGADSGESRGFVGGQATEVSAEDIQSAITEPLVRPGATVNVNRPLAPQVPRSTEMYRPRLSIGFNFTRQTPRDTSLAARNQLRTSHAIHSTAAIEVSIAGRTATVRGAVASEHERKLAELLLLFEPGISEVTNELEVKPPDPRPAAESLERDVSRP